MGLQRRTFQMEGGTGGGDLDWLLETLPKES